MAVGLRAWMRQVGGFASARVAATAVLAAAALAGSALASGSAGVGVRSAGAVQVTRPASGEGAGTTVTLADAAARATLELADGSTLRLVGPADLRVVEATPTGTRVELTRGIVCDARVRGVPVEIQTGHGVSLVLQNARGWARVVPGDSVTFHRRSGEYARVHHGERTYDLGTNSWRIHLAETTAAGPVERHGAAAGRAENAGPAAFSRKR